MGAPCPPCFAYGCGCRVHRDTLGESPRRARLFQWSRRTPTRRAHPICPCGIGVLTRRALWCVSVTSSNSSLMSLPDNLRAELHAVTHEHVTRALVFLLLASA